MRIPADADIRALHEEHAPTRAALESVYTHCQVVCAIAEQLAAARGRAPLDQAPLDLALARAGALLHDVGVYRLYDDAGRLDLARYIRHGVEGHALLAEAGLAPELCRFASCHTGVGITREDVIRQRLPLPEADYVARTPEERLVMYADTFHSKTEPPSFLAAQAFAARIAKFGADKVAAFTAMRAELGDPDLAALSAAFGHRITGAVIGQT